MKENLLGLLLQAHAQSAAQAHGEEFVHSNVSAMMSYQMVMRGIEAAIHDLFIAQMHVSFQDGQKKRLKEQNPPSLDNPKSS